MELNNYLFQLVYQGSGYWPLLDRIFILITTYITYAVIIATILHFILHPFLSRNKINNIFHRQASIHIIFTSLLTWLAVWLIKIIISHPRPFIAIEDVVPLVNAAPFQSFPSAHAALTIALAISVLRYHKHLGHLLAAFSFVVSLSRLYVGVHYPFDIGVGLLIGFLIAKFINSRFAHRKK